MNKRACISGALVAAFTVSPACASIIVGGLSVGAQTNAFVLDGPDRFDGNAFNYNTYYSAPQSLTGMAVSAASLNQGAPQATATARTQLEFNNTATLTFRVATERSLTNSASSLAVAGGGGGVSYSFYADKIYSYSVKYRIENSNIFAGNGNFLGLSDRNGYRFLRFAGLNESGVATGFLNPGLNTLQINNYSVDAKYYFESQNFSGTSNADYEFSLTPFTGVPEPASWALLVGGFVLTGTQIRKKRRTAPLRPCATVMSPSNHSANAA